MRNSINLHGFLRSAFSMILIFAAVGCSSSNFLDVKSDPAEADVFIYNDKGEKKPVGKTPLQMPKDALKAALGKDTSSGEFFTVGVEKNGFVPQTYSFPATRFGTSLVSLTVKLKPGEKEKEMSQAKEALDHLFLAQKLAVALQFERAQIEIDKVLASFPGFARALSMRASIYYAQKNYQEAMKWYEETLKAAPDMEDAVKMLAKVRVLLHLPPGQQPPATSAGATAQAPAVPVPPATGAKQ